MGHVAGGLPTSGEDVDASRNVFSCLHLTAAVKRIISRIPIYLAWIK